MESLKEPVRNCEYWSHRNMKKPEYSPTVQFLKKKRVNTNLDELVTDTLIEDLARL